MVSNFPGTAGRHPITRYPRLRGGRLFGDVFARLDPAQFQNCFISWTQASAELLPGEVVAIDGKTARRSYDRVGNKGAMHPYRSTGPALVSAWATQNTPVSSTGPALTLGQVKTAAKSNEITAIPQLLDLLYRHGCIVTIDAMGCQREIAQQIVDGGADYVLAVKENQGQLYQGIRDLFQEAEASDFDGAPYDCAQTVNKGHGRVERRECWVVTAADCLDYINPQGQWPQLKAAIKVVGHRKTAAGSASQPRYYISSLAAPAEQLLAAIRAIGASRTRCIGPWMQPFTKTSAECGKACPRENGGSWAAKHGHATADRAQSVEKGEHPQSRHPRQTAQRRLE